MAKTSTVIASFRTNNGIDGMANVWNWNREINMDYWSLLYDDVQIIQEHGSHWTLALGDEQIEVRNVMILLRQRPREQFLSSANLFVSWSRNLW